MKTKQILEKLINCQDLTEVEAIRTMTGIMEGDYTASQMASMLTALRMKGETITEITAFAKVMRAKATPIPVQQELLLDTCGTGGDQTGSFNISTTVALLLAGGGYKVAKHGNRSMTSKSGSADLLEALGININLTPEQVSQCITDVGIGFLFAPAFHSATKNVVPVRKDLAVRTIFNLLGPLTNPASANVQTMGIFSPKLVPKIIRVLKELGLRSAYVYSAANGMDEVSIADNTSVGQLTPQGEIQEFTFKPEEYGFQKSSLAEIKGGTAAENAEITRAILNNTLAGPKRDIVQINAGFAISAMEDIDLKEGIAKADTLLKSKVGQVATQRLIEKSHSFQ